MSCKNCAQFRQAVLHARMAEAAGLAVDKFREVFGLNPKGEPLVDPETLPSLSGKTKAELLAIAADEGVTVEPDATNAEIIEAIDEKRQAEAWG